MRTSELGQAAQLTRRQAAEVAARFQSHARFISINQHQNRHRFYVLSWQPGLFGGGALLRSWGRIGTKGRSLLAFYEDRGRAQAAAERIIRRRLRHGYRVIDQC